MLVRLEIFVVAVLDDLAGSIEIPQTHRCFLKVDRVPAVVGQIIAMLEMQDGSFGELVAPMVTERLDDADRNARR